MASRVPRDEDRSYRCRPFGVSFSCSVVGSDVRVGGGEVRA